MGCNLPYILEEKWSYKYQVTAHAYMARQLLSNITPINNLGKLSQQDLEKSSEDYKLPSNIGIWLSKEENST